VSKISIFGLGWLGWPLAKYLSEQGASVLGSVTSAEKAESLNAQIPEISVQVWNANITHDIPAGLFAPTTIITLPPGKVEHYAQTLIRVIQQAKTFGVRHLIYISSTSVYGGMGICDETTMVNPETEQAEQLIQVEQCVQAAGFPLWHIIRPAGLFGPGRFPARFMSGKHCAGGGRKVNLVHQKDIVRAITILIKSSTAGVYNLASPSHPTRADFYSLACLRADKTPPVFTDMMNDGKVICADKIEQDTMFRYEVRDLIDWLEQSEPE